MIQNLISSVCSFSLYLDFFRYTVCIWRFFEDLDQKSSPPNLSSFGGGGVVYWGFMITMPLFLTHCFSKAMEGMKDMNITKFFFRLWLHECGGGPPGEQGRHERRIPQQKQHVQQIPCLQVNCPGLIMVNFCFLLGRLAQGLNRFK